jgi:hypothetical protein
MSRFGKIFSASCVCVAFGASALSARAQQSILVDLGSDTSFRGVSVPNPDAHGNRWNSLTPGLLAPALIDRTGALTLIGIGWDTPVATDSFNGPAGVTSFPHPTPAEVAIAASKINTPAAQAALGNLAVPEAVIDFAASPGGTNNNTIFDIQGLDPSARYTLRLYGSHIFSGNQQTVYTVGTGFNPTTFTLTGVQGTATINVDEIDTADPFMPPNIPNTTQVGVISNLAPTPAGLLFVDFIGAQGDLGYLNAFELVRVPEPTAGMALCAVGCLLAKRRRR